MIHPSAPYCGGYFFFGTLIERDVIEKNERRADRKRRGYTQQEQLLWNVIGLLVFVGGFFKKEKFETPDAAKGLGLPPSVFQVATCAPILCTNLTCLMDERERGETN